MVDRPKLNIINDYNQAMNAVDRADQVRTNYSCSVKSMKWWHPVFWWIVDTAITIAFILHRDYCEDALTHPQFMSKLANQLMERSKKRRHSSSDSASKRVRTQEAHKHCGPSRLVGQHHLVKVQPSGGATSNPQRRCVVCLEKDPKSSKKSVYECFQCEVGLHVECFPEYHAA